MADTVWNVKSIALFDGLNPAQVHNLIDIAHKTDYKNGSVICRYGEINREIFILVKGKIEIISGKGVSLYFLKEKEVFGEISFVCGLPCNANVIASEDTTALLINHNLLENLSATDPLIKQVLLHNMVTSLGDKLHQANSRIENLTTENSKLKALIKPTL